MIHLIILILLLNGCAPKKIYVDPPTYKQQVYTREGIDDNFFVMEIGAVPFTLEQHVTEWERAKDIYIEKRKGLTGTQKKFVRESRWSGLYDITAVRPVNWYSATYDGKPVRIPRFYSDFHKKDVQGYFDPVQRRIAYANPYCLVCEYFHYFELIVNPTLLRDNWSDGEGMFMYDIVGHCTPDDPMSLCCWSDLAYKVPWGDTIPGNVRLVILSQDVQLPDAK